MANKLLFTHLKKSQTIVIVLLSLCFMVFSTPLVFADGDVTWGTFAFPKSGSIDMTTRGGVLELLPQRFTFEIFDDALIGSGVDFVSVKVTSNVDPQGITLTLANEDQDGTIQNDNIVPMRSQSIFQISDTAKVTYTKICSAPGINCDDNVIDTVNGTEFSIKAYSDSSFNKLQETSVPIHLIETGKNTKIFEGRLKFTTGPSVPGEFPNISQLQVSPGDTITTRGIPTIHSSGIILPVSEDKVAIQMELLGTLTVTYVSQDGITHIQEIGITDIQPGGFGGGPVNAGLVVDSSSSVASSGGGCSGDCGPPTLGIDKNYNRIVTDGFSFNGNPVDVKRFYTPYPLITVNVGEENTAVLKIYENGGIDKIAHVGLAFGLGENKYFSDSRATINLDRSNFGAEIVTLFDPENVLDNVKVETEKTTCSNTSDIECLKVTIYHTFREPLEFNMVGTNVWDKNRNSWQNFYNHGIEIIGLSMNPPDEYIGIYKGDLVRIFETGKNTAIDENGNNWTFDREWKMDYIPKGKLDDGVSSHGYDRNHVMFDTYKKGQVLIAQQKLNEILNGKAIDNDELKEPKTFYGKFLSRSENLILQNTIESEKLRAEQIFSTFFSKIKHNHQN